MPETKFRKETLARCRQGDIFREIEVPGEIVVKDEELEVTSRHLGYGVILSQDCDLEHDFNNRSTAAPTDHDKYLPSILLLPAYLADQFRVGQHLSEVGLTMGKFSTDPWKKLKSNQIVRYHFIGLQQDFHIPELVIDFKHFFTVPRDLMYQEFKGNYLASLDDLFREDLSHRFAHYLSRIGLPEPAPALGETPL